LLSIFDLSPERALPEVADDTAEPAAESTPGRPLGLDRPQTPVAPLRQLPATPVLPPADPPPEPAPQVISKPRPQAGKREFNTPECERVRTRADEARRTQAWGSLRDLSKKRTCWPTDAEARKLQTKALMELGDFTGCMSAGQGLKDKEVEQWRKLCERRGG
jgi:serine/threonine-protein kinase